MDCFNLFDIEVPNKPVRKRKTTQKVPEQEKSTNSNNKQKKNTISIDNLEIMRPYRIEIEISAKKTVSCVFYKHEYGGYITDDPYILNLRSKYPYRINTIDLCQTIDNCPNNFPDCSSCSIYKKRKKR